MVDLRNSEVDLVLPPSVADGADSLPHSLGASGWRITRLLSSDFMRMVLIAVVIALPVSYWIASRWLGNFAFRIELHAGYFAMAGFGILLIALLTVGFQTLKAASINPAECLRDE